MQYNKFFLFTVLLLSVVFLSMRSKNTNYRNVGSELDGAWVSNMQGNELSLLFADGYCMFSVYNKEQKKFIRTSGGPFEVKDGKVFITVEFSNTDKTEVGKIHEHGFIVNGDNLTTSTQGFEMKWKRVDAGGKNLAGNWRITQRKEGDKIFDIPLRSRRTLKLLTASRFQWAAINIETGEFFGTGGGTYTFEDGKYTEHIEFFSRDSTRVGMDLGFDGKLENGNWVHSGKSSKGNPIYEVWSRMR